MIGEDVGAYCRSKVRKIINRKDGSFFGFLDDNTFFSSGGLCVFRCNGGDWPFRCKEDWPIKVGDPVVFFVSHGDLGQYTKWIAPETSLIAALEQIRQRRTFRLVDPAPIRSRLSRKHENRRSGDRELWQGKNLVELRHRFMYVRDGLRFEVLQNGEWMRYDGDPRDLYIGSACDSGVPQEA